MVDEVTTAAGADDAAAQDAAADAAAVTAGLIDDPAAPAQSVKPDTPPAKSTKAKRTDKAPAPAKDAKAVAEPFKASRKQIDAMRELGMTDERIDTASEAEAKASETARSLSSKQTGKLARKLDTLTKEIAELKTAPANRDTSETAGADKTTVSFAPPDATTLTDMFGSADSPEKQNYVAALERGRKVDLLEARLNAVESGAADKEASQGQRTVDAFFDGLDQTYHPDFGKTDALEGDSDEEAARVKVCDVARKLASGDDGMELGAALKSALNVVRPDALEKQATDRLLKQIEERGKETIGSPSGRKVERPPHELTPEEVDVAADSAARELGLI